MAGPPVQVLGIHRIQLSFRGRRIWLAGVIAANVTFTAATTLFIALWSRMDGLTPGIQWFTRYILVQGHLATENVVAAWYSSMLLLVVAALSALAWAADRRLGTGWQRHGWLVFASIFTVLSLDEIGSLHERIGMIPIVSRRAIGWVYLLAPVIAAVGGGMAAFAWLHLRKVRGVLWLTLAGIVMFLLDPVAEAIEMAMIHGAGAAAGTWQRTLHDVLLVVEEGGLELFGILSFLAGVTLYVVTTTGETSQWSPARRDALRLSRLMTVTLAAGVVGVLWAGGHLPAADSGRPENWFPSVAWLVVAGVAVTRVDGAPWARRVTGIAATCLSAWWGAGLYVYVEWLASRASWVAPVTGVAAAGLALEALLRDYRLSRSPRSSIASPTLRRPRPNPS